MGAEPLSFALIERDAKRIGRLATQAFFQWQRDQCRRVGAALHLATGIPTPGDPYSVQFSEYCQAREDAARRKERQAES